VALFCFVEVAQAQLIVTVDRNFGPTINKEFKFKTARVAPVKDDAAQKATVRILSAEADPTSGDVAALTDGALPEKEDDAKANFFFADGSAGGRLTFDLGEAIDVRQINTYSWHSGPRAPQVYRLYASDGTDAHFCAAPPWDVVPTDCGWRLLTTVDTRRNRGDGGGQYVVSIADAKTLIGHYRYLLFVVSAAETEDDTGNTFFSEVDVIARKLGGN
jgi:hypothetical protein